MDRVEAIKQMHFPKSSKELERAKKRLGFEEVFGLTLAALLNREELLNEKSVRIPFDKELAVKFTKNLPLN